MKLAIYLCTIGVLPDFHEYYAGVEPVEYEQGQADAGDDSPRQEPVEPTQKGKMQDCPTDLNRIRS